MENVRFPHGKHKKDLEGSLSSPKDFLFYVANLFANKRSHPLPLVLNHGAKVTHFKLICN